MIASDIIPVLAALCGFLLTNGNAVDVNLDDVKMEYCDEDIMGPWEPVLINKNTVDVKLTTKKELPADLIVKFDCEIEGTDLPPYETSVCTTMEDEVIGKGVFESLEPEVKNCPIKAGDYKIVEWSTKKLNVPNTVPSGKFNVKVTVAKASDGKPCLILKVKGNLVHNLPG